VDDRVGLGGGHRVEHGVAVEAVHEDGAGTERAQGVGLGLGAGRAGDRVALGDERGDQCAATAPAAPAMKTCMSPLTRRPSACDGTFEAARSGHTGLFVRLTSNANDSSDRGRRRPPATGRRAHARRLRQEASADLSPSLISALASIDRHGPLTPSELASHERVQRPTRRASSRGSRSSGSSTARRTRRPPLVAHLASAAGPRAAARQRSRKDLYLARRLATLEPDESRRSTAPPPSSSALLDEEARR
jgi:hypothetical protein